MVFKKLLNLKYNIKSNNENYKMGCLLSEPNSYIFQQQNIEKNKYENIWYVSNKLKIEQLKMINEGLTLDIELKKLENDNKKKTIELNKLQTNNDFEFI